MTLQQRNAFKLGSCRLFDKPLLNEVLEDYINLTDDVIKIDTGEYYQNEHIIRKYIYKYPNRKFEITYKLWIYNGNKTKDIHSRMMRACKLLKHQNVVLKFMLHTPTPMLRWNLLEIKKQLESFCELVVDFEFLTSNFYIEELKVFHEIFGYYPKVNQLELNLNSLMLTEETLFFMKENGIHLEVYGSIRRGQYLNDQDLNDHIESSEPNFTGPFKALEYAFCYIMKWLEDNGIIYHICCAPNRGRPCIEWYFNMEPNKIRTPLLYHKTIRQFKDSPDYCSRTLNSESSKLTGNNGHVYLAGPLFDRGQIRNRKHDQKWIEEKFPTLSIYNPINHNEETWDGMNPQPTSCMTFYNKDKEEILKADIMIADLDGMDPGTICEIGNAVGLIWAKRKPNFRLIVIATNWEYWTPAIEHEANPTVGINDYLEGAIRECGFFVRNFDELQNYLEDYVFDFELDNVGKKV